KVVIEKESTTVIHGAGKPADIRARIETLRKEADDTKSDYDREKLEGRIAKLSGGVAIIKVGAATEIEMKEKKARVEDALHVTRLALQNAASVAGLLLTTEVTAVEAPKKKAPPAPPAAPDMDDEF